MASVVMLALPASAEPANWAHQAAGFQSNGQVTVKSLNGGSYAGTQNPTGAVAKVNQNANTQPPTVIIQATSSNYIEIIPKLSLNTTNVPPCPSGYNNIFKATSADYGMSPRIFNAAGTRFSFVPFLVLSTGRSTYGWVIDNLPTLAAATTSAGAIFATENSWTDNNPPPGGWAAALCSR